MKTRIKTFCALLLTVAGMVTLLGGCYFLPQEEQFLEPPLREPQEVSYRTYTVQRDRIDRELSGTGRFVSTETQLLQYKGTGARLKTMHVKSGDEVKAGDLLAELDPGDLPYQIYRQEKQLRLAELDLQTAKKTKDKNTIERAQINYDLVNMELTRLNERMAECLLYTDMNGMVIYVADVEPGESVYAYQTLVQVADAGSLQIRFTTNDVKELYIGTEIEVTLSTKDKPTLIGRVVQVPENLPITATEEEKKTVYIELDEVPAEVKIGDTVAIKLLLERKEGVILLPLRYVSSYSSRRYVRVLNADNIPEERDLILGIQNATEVEVVSGLEEGERIVI